MAVRAALTRVAPAGAAATARAAPRTALRASMTATSARTFASAAHKLPDLPYEYHELEPALSAEIMELHHSKHHNTYVTNLNNALDAYGDAEAKGDVEKMIELQGALRFNGGGHINHSIFWTNLAPPSKGGGEAPEGELAKYIDTAFGGFDAFKAQFNGKAAAIQGSGWGWLGYNVAKDRVEIATTPNQDPCTLTGLVPLLGIDMWEHAYYLVYRNVRPDYLNAVWEVVNMQNVAERLAAAKAKK